MNIIRLNNNGEPFEVDTRGSEFINYLHNRIKELEVKWAIDRINLGINQDAENILNVISTENFRQFYEGIFADHIMNDIPTKQTIIQEIVKLFKIY